MRNTIFTETAAQEMLARRPSSFFPRHAGRITGGFLAVYAGAATAGNVPEGCFARAYSDDHLARVPEQSVVQMLALVEPDPTERMDAQVFLKVLFREGGLGAENVTPGLWYGQTVFCRQEGGPTPPGWARTGDLTCFAECDGGAVQIADFDGQTLALRTGGLFVDEAGGECEGNAFLAPEGQESVIFRLHSVDLNFCLSQ
ncbi:hypothetical protein R3X27_20185 [Tropicimonas sp. TH_r6]|uniref:hypothetical protein n=1 Tax=Tropicimonas sp. TH_r6 TaxID=3082085 RepID=UPI0029540252|nr:hypothetical protein [Tropicimonas sp. TH_r6]MDV7145005.1 hypothetical protein [Tropicimonas sp. TH_r6]